MRACVCMCVTPCARSSSFSSHGSLLLRSFCSNTSKKHRENTLQPACKLDQTNLLYHYSHFCLYGRSAIFDTLLPLPRPFSSSTVPPAQQTGDIQRHTSHTSPAKEQSKTHNDLVRHTHTLAGCMQTQLRHRLVCAHNISNTARCEETN